jgi:exosortase A
MNKAMYDGQSSQVSQQVGVKGMTFSVISIFLLLSILGIFYQTTSSMVSTWIRSETYTHGFLILPIVIWLVWQKRELLSHYPPAPSYIALIPLSIAGMVWMLGYLVDVLVVQQLALVAMLVLSFLVVMGLRLFKVLLFPLIFLFFAVPMGEGLVPAMMEYTATMTVTLVKLSGIPVYRDGMFISLPSGNWSVVEACSGVRYLISSITLGCLFAYINYSSYRKRFIFIVVSAIVPIVANGLRAYMIVMLGHLSGMELAVGVDHLIYGWVFFGLVMLVLFSIGSKWRDLEDHEKVIVNSSEQSLESTSTTTFVRKHLIAPFLVTLVAVSLWPAWVYALNQYQRVVAYTEIQIPDGQINWQKNNEKLWKWTPRSVGADQEVNQFYSFTSNHSEPIGLHVAFYSEQQQGAEVVNSRNKLFNNTMPRWRVAKKSTKRVMLNGQEITVISAVVTGPRESLLVWYWYRIGRYYTADNYMAKFREVEARLFDGRQDAAILTISTPINIGDDEKEAAVADKSLQLFLTEMLPGIEHSLDYVVGQTRNSD